MKSSLPQFLKLRQETPNDYEEVFQLVKESFSGEKYSDHEEHFLVQRLRKSNHFIPNLSIVAAINNKIVGYILLTTAGIKNDNEIHPTLALAPVTVLRDYQNQGIGSELIAYAHNSARELGYTSIVLVGHEDYYPRFGYEPAHKYNINFPFNIPDKYCMVLFLKPEIALKIQGTVHYPKEFFQ